MTYLWNTKAPIAPDWKGYWVSRLCYFLENHNLWPKFGGWNWQKAHLRQDLTFQPITKTLLTFCSKVLTRTSSSPEKPLFQTILANFAKFRWPILAKSVKRHIYTPTPFIWTYNQVSLNFRSKVKARTRKRWQITDTHNFISPNFGVGA